MSGPAPIIAGGQLGFVVPSAPPEPSGLTADTTAETADTTEHTADES